MRHPTVARHEGRGTEKNGCVLIVYQLRNRFVVQRAWVEIDRNTFYNWQKRTRCQAEAVKHRQSVEKLVACRNIDDSSHLLDICVQIRMSQNDTLWLAFTA